MNVFFVDAETDGLHGPFLSVAALVTDNEGTVIDRFSASVRATQDAIKDPWVREHVLPYLACATTRARNETELLERFWNFWTKHRASSMCVADVPFPVEARLFSRCIASNPEERGTLGPYPLYDLATALLATGVDPATPRTELAPLGLEPHDAASDVYMAAHIWHSMIAPGVAKNEE